MHAHIQIGSDNEEPLPKLPPRLQEVQRRPKADGTDEEGRGGVEADERPPEVALLSPGETGAQETLQAIQAVEEATSEARTQRAQTPGEER